MNNPSRTEVVMRRGLPEPILPPRDSRSMAAILTQEGPMSIAADVAGSVNADGITTEIIVLPDREEAKTLESASSVYETLGHLGFRRGDTVVGVGGGSVTDVSGYIAGTWLRGVESVNVPTTMLGAVDAALGGKTGLNLAGKNLVGVIWHPSRVIIDIAMMESLPPHLKGDGLVEALKTGLVANSELSNLITRHGVEVDLERVITASVEAKMSIVAEDHREKGRRAILNFGHTIGHAIEFASNLSHGQSVGLGMIAAAAVSEKRLGFGGLPSVMTAIESLGMPSSIHGLDTQRLLELLQHDKKRDESGLRMVLLRDIGAPVISSVDESDLELALASIGL
ncbi:MAG: 3-dehydroquinate synthase family protein [Acidimicrobiia bacterium]|nr:3-dehydroquinate synthase family protein [Acidimicrobiia bacterium]